MGNAHCRVKNNTDEPQQVKVFNYADCIRKVSRSTCTIKPGCVHKVEAAAHLSGLIIQVQNLDLCVGNGKTVTISKVLNNGQRGASLLCGTVARVRQMKEKMLKHRQKRLVKVWTIKNSKACGGHHAGIMMEFEGLGFATLDFSGSGLDFDGPHKSQREALRSSNWQIHDKAPKTPGAHTDLEDVYNYLEEEWHGIYYSFAHCTKWHNRSNCYGFRDHFCNWVEGRHSAKRRRIH